MSEVSFLSYAPEYQHMQHTANALDALKMPIQVSGHNSYSLRISHSRVGFSWAIGALGWERGRRTLLSISTEILRELLIIIEWPFTE